MSVTVGIPLPAPGGRRGGCLSCGCCWWTTSRSCGRASATFSRPSPTSPSSGECGNGVEALEAIAAGAGGPRVPRHPDARAGRARRGERRWRSRAARRYLRHRLQRARGARLRGERGGLRAQAVRPRAVLRGPGPGPRAPGRATRRSWPPAGSRRVLAELQRAQGHAAARCWCGRTAGSGSWRWTTSTGSRRRTTTRGCTSGAERHLIRETMGSLEARLDPARFARIHRSAIVNLAQDPRAATDVQRGVPVFLHSGAKLTLSRGYRDALRERIGSGW